MNVVSDYILPIVINTAFVINIMLFLRLFFAINTCRQKYQYVLIGAAFILVNGIIALLFEQKPWVQIVVIYGFMVRAAFLVSKQNLLKVAFFTMVAILLDVQWSKILELVGKLLGLDEYTMIIEGKTESVVSCFTDVVIFFLLIFIIHVVSKKKVRIQLKIGEAMFLFFFCIFSPMVIGIFELLEDTFQSKSYNVAWIFFIVALNIAVFYGIVYRNHAGYYKELSENFKKQFDSEYAYFKDYKEKQKDMAKFRHDYRNHMLLLESMLEKGEYEKAKEYFNHLSGRGEKLGKRILTGNEIVDMLLNAKQEQLEGNNIEVICNGGLEPLQFLENVDCCILFSNLIDNAIEANKKCEKERHITIKTTKKDAVYMVEISNRTEGNIERHGNFLKTSKDNQEEHGLGTGNVFEVIEKYRGEYRFFVRGKDFVMQMVFFTDRLSQK